MKARNCSVTWAHTTCSPWSLASVRHVPSRNQPVIGDVLHVAKPAPSAFRGPGGELEGAERNRSLSPACPCGLGNGAVGDLERETSTGDAADDSSEDGYEVRVYDAFGEVVYETLDIPGSSGAPTVVHTPTGLELISGMVYQFRTWSWRQKQGSRTYISTTEDLRGVFLYLP